MAKIPTGFVSLKSLKRPLSSPGEVLAEIRRIYFKTTRLTVEHDIAHAIDLLKSLESDDDREKAAVYMHGLAEMRREWGPKKAASRKPKKGA